MSMREHEEIESARSLIEMWLKTSAHFWSSVSEPNGNGTDRKASHRGDSRDSSRAEETLQSTMRLVAALASSMTEPEAAESWAKGLNSLPEVLVKMTQPLSVTFFIAQQEWLKKAGIVGRCASDFRLDDFTNHSVRVFTEIYEKEFRQFFHLPQVGLARTYQERFNRALDRFNLFQAALGEFLSLLYLPVEQSMRLMQDKLAEMTDSGKLPYDSKKYYQIWIKILETHYATLFKSPQYLEALGRTIDSVNEFIIARTQMLQDALKVLPVPTQKEMDELYREMYTLKKKVKKLEKTVSVLSRSQA